MIDKIILLDIGRPGHKDIEKIFVGHVPLTIRLLGTWRDADRRTYPGMSVSAQYEADMSHVHHWMLVLQDPNITVDLRVNNGFKGTSFDEFWNELKAYFNEVKIYIKANY